MFWRRKTKQLTEPLVCDGGYRALPPEQVLRAHDALFRRFRAEVDFPPGEIKPRFDDLILRLAAYIHGLPAAQHGQYRSPAGLLGKCLRTAFLAQRIAHGRVVASELPADARTQAERSWRYAALVGGLIYPLGILSQLGAQSLDRRKIWRPEYGPLTDWLSQNRLTTYRPYWHTADRPYATPATIRLWLAGALLDGDTLGFMSTETGAYLEAMIGLLGDELPEHEPMHGVVHRAATEAIRVGLLSSVDETRGQPGDDPRERLLDCLALAAREWAPHDPDTLVRTTGTGHYLLWPHLARALRSAAARHDLLALPAADDELLALLHRSGVIETTAEGALLHEVALTERAGGVLVSAVRLSPECDLELRLPDIPDTDTGVSRDSPPGIGSTTTPPEAPDETAGPEAPEPSEPATQTARKSCPAAAIPGLGTLGAYLGQALAVEPGVSWWTDAGRAFRWPDVAEQAGVPPQEMLRALRESDAAVQSPEAALPLLHEVSREGQATMAIIIRADRWPPKVYA